MPIEGGACKPDQWILLVEKVAKYFTLGTVRSLMTTLFQIHCKSSIWRKYCARVSWHLFDSHRPKTRFWRHPVSCRVPLLRSLLSDRPISECSFLPVTYGYRTLIYLAYCIKVAHTRLPSVGFRSWSRFLAVSLQVRWVINPAVGCHYFPPGLQLPPQPLRGRLPILLLGEERHNGCEQFA